MAEPADQRADQTAAAAPRDAAAAPRTPRDVEAARAELAKTLAKCRNTYKETGETMNVLADAAPPAGCIVPVVHTPDAGREPTS